MTDGPLFKTFPFVDGSSNLVVPVLNPYTNMLDIRVVSAVLAAVRDTQIKFTDCDTSSGCDFNYDSVIGFPYNEVSTNSAYYYFLLSGPGKFLLFVAPTDLSSSFVSPRVWETPSSSASYNFVGYADVIGLFVAATG